MYVQGSVLDWYSFISGNVIMSFVKDILIVHEMIKRFDVLTDTWEVY